VSRGFVLGCGLFQRTFDRSELGIRVGLMMDVTVPISNQIALQKGGVFGQGPESDAMSIVRHKVDERRKLKGKRRPSRIEQDLSQQHGCMISIFYCSKQKHHQETKKQREVRVGFIGHAYLTA